MNRRLITRMRNLTILLLSWMTFITAADYVPRTILVQREKDISNHQFSQIIQSKDYRIEKLLVPRLGIYKIYIVSDNISEEVALAHFRQNPFVRSAQLDHYVSRRQSFPDDTQFSQQWDMHNTGVNGAVEDADIDAPEAWDITTGGLTVLGDTIVVAVVDGGCDLNHNDLVSNIWTNYHEIPGNNIDDDNNGYIDDIHGWDAYDSDGSPPSNNHGTHVTGTVGAVGNNGNQVSGVNWNVKVMIVAASSSVTSVVMEGYGYALEMRSRYNETNGDSGAFVVSTNSSFGIDFADCTSGNYPLWNEMFSAMGEQGILSAAATMNNSSNVDQTGDVPTGCSSDWLITVTNTTSSDTRNSGAAYGQNSIDLGAPGTAILSTLPNNATGVLTGTSMATPHVAGAVALMHAAMNYGFAQFYRANPGEGALALKQIILDGTDLLASLENVTVSGGRLNIYNSAVMAQTFMAADSLDPNPVTDVMVDTSQIFYIHFSWTDPTTLFGGDSIPDFVIDIIRDGILQGTVNGGVEQFSDGPLAGGTLYQYNFITRLVASDRVSTPYILNVMAPGGTLIPGDATHDGQVDVTDIIRVLRFILQYDTPDEYDMATADIDYDGVLTVYDILGISDIILHGR